MHLHAGDQRCAAREPACKRGRRCWRGIARCAWHKSFRPPQREMSKTPALSRLQEDVQAAAGRGRKNDSASMTSRPVASVLRRDMCGSRVSTFFLK